MSFYRGYVITKDKKCIDKFKDVPDANLKTFEQVKLLDEYAGIIANDSILVDVDNMTDSELIFKICDENDIRCQILQSRSGMHFLFKNSKVGNCATNTTLACGIKADIKSGKKNSYEVLKIDGVEREVLYDIFENEEYQEIPKWLYPIKNCNIDFKELGEGDGRNQTLFNYILTLQSNNFSTEEIKETINIINKYILKEPVSDNELEVILRDDAFKKQSFFSKNTFLHDKFAHYIKNTYHVKKINGQLHCFKEGVYVPGNEDIERAMIKEISVLTDAKRKEVLKHLYLICDEVESFNLNLIAFRNGIYNISTDKLLQFNPSIVITNKIPWDYNPNAKSKLVDDVLNMISCDDLDIRSLLEECCGSCFYRSNKLAGGKAFILTGNKNNGKSTFLEMLKDMLGKRNTSVLDLKKLDDRFSTIMLYNKLANIGDDISDEYRSDVSTFKKIVTGNSIDAEQKGQPKFDFEPYVKLIFSANDIPRMKDDTGATQRRLVIVPFNAVLTKETMGDRFDPNIKYSLQSQDSMEYLIQLGIHGLKRVLKNKVYTSSKKVEVELIEYEKDNNPILSFVDEVGIDSILNEPTSDIYKQYGIHCAANGRMAISKTKFTRQLKSSFGITTKDAKDKNRKSIRVYVHT